MNRRVRSVITRSDVIIEVLDARFPELTRNREIEHLIKKKGKFLVFALNKADLVTKEWAEEWKKRLSKEAPVVFTSAKKRWGTRMLRDLIRSLTEKKPLYIGVVGFPNTGKSSLINVLVGRSSAGVSPKPGFTKGEQIIRLSKGVYLIDSPGDFDVKDEVIQLITGAKDPSKAVNPELTAELIIKNLNRYGDLPFSSLEEYAVKKRFLLKGGEPDLIRAAVDVIRRFQRGEFTKNYSWINEL